MFSMTHRTFFLPTFFLTGSISTACLQGADYHVSPTGLDTNPGTLAQPWLTIQKAANTVIAGDVVNIHAGTYYERVSLINRDGTATQPIIFKKYPSDPGSAIVSQNGVTPPNGLSAIFTIRSCDYLVLQGLEISDYKTSGTAAQQRAQLPAGIYVNGGADGVQILDCKVHDIWQSSPTKYNFDASGYGIAVYGDDTQPINNLIIDGCEVSALRTGASESVVLNGNVTNFAVTNNTVHDCNNIGIDFIGFEGTNATPALDQARYGTCSGNTVYRIDSKFNPAYGGNFTTGGGNGTRSAPGLYVDGGRDILIERNHVYDCNYALSAGSEHSGQVASNIIVRNNILNHCHVGGIVIGGSDSAANGGLSSSSFTHNTLYQNDTVGYGGGQFSVQNYVSGTTIQRNLMASTASFVQFILNDSTTSSFAAGAIDWNLYRKNNSASYEFILNGVAQSTFAGWQSVAGDPHSTLKTTALGLVAASPTASSPASDFALTTTSPAKDTGDSAALPFTPATGETDYFGQARVYGSRVDIGADEFQ